MSHRRMVPAEKPDGSLWPRGPHLLEAVALVRALPAHATCQSLLVGWEICPIADVADHMAGLQGSLFHQCTVVVIIYASPIHQYTIATAAVPPQREGTWSPHSYGAHIGNPS